MATAGIIAGVSVGLGLVLGVFLLGFALIFGGVGLKGLGLALLGVGHVGWWELLKIVVLEGIMLAMRVKACELAS